MARPLLSLPHTGLGFKMKCGGKERHEDAFRNTNNSRVGEGKQPRIRFAALRDELATPARRRLAPVALLGAQTPQQT